MRPRHHIFICIILTAILVSCGSGDTSVPRPHAFPRIEMYDTVSRVVDLGYGDIRACAAADIRVKGVGACDIVYPRYGATIYVSIVPAAPDSLDYHWANRNQRIALNLEGTPAYDAAVSAPAGCVARLVVADGVCVTPVQSVCIDTVRAVVLNATAFMHNPLPDATSANVAPSAVDSLRPVVQALTADLRRLVAAFRPAR